MTTSEITLSSFEDLFIKNIIAEDYNSMDCSDTDETFIYKVHWTKDDTELYYLTAEETHWAFKYDVSVNYIKVSKSSPEFSLAYLLSKKRTNDKTKKDKTRKKNYINFYL